MAEIHLSPRETQVLQGLADGKTTEFIAFELKICRKTMQNYTKSARTKLGAQSTTEAVAKAITLGLINIDIRQIYITLECQHSFTQST